MPIHIQIGNITPRIQYTADGTQTVFTFPFPIFKNGDIEVYLDHAKQATGYTILGAGESNGGNVSFATAPTANVVVTLDRNIAIERLSDFQESGVLRSKTINDEMDYLTASLQQVSDGQSRSLQKSITETSNANMTLPSPAAHRVLSWNGTADGFANGPTADEVTNAQGYSIAAQTAQTGAESAQANAATSETNASSSASAAATAAASNMYARNAAKATNFAVTLADNGTQFLIDTSAGNVTVSLPLGSTAIDGFRVALAKTSADNNAVLVNTQGTDTINGGTSWQFSVPQGQSVIALDTTPAPDIWFAAGVGLVAPIGVADIHNNAKPYDVAFVAGFNASMIADPIAVQTYGELVVPRAVTLTGEQLYMDVASTGAAAIFDILKNGVSVYAVKPQVAIGLNVGTAGTFAIPSLAAGDRVTFACTQIGSTVVGSGARFTLAGVLA